MENLIKEIMDELFAIDPSLKKYQKELEAATAKMIANKPDDRFDENFRQELKMKLLARAEELEKGEKVKFSFWRSLKFWRGFSLAAVVAALALIVVIPAIQNGQFSLFNFKSGSPLSLISGTMNIEEAGERAFGDLASSSQALTNLELGDSSDAYYSAPTPAAAPKTQSSTSREEILAREVSGLGGGSGTNAAAPDVKMLPPEYATKYNYVYIGEDFSFTEESVAVLKRLKSYGSENLSSVLNNLSFGLFDASKLRNVKVQSMSIAEDRDGGYVVDFNPYEGTISFYENWQKIMPVNYETQPRLRESDVPTDEKLIETANDFLSRFGIDRGNYGTPIVGQSWKLGYANVRDEDIWIPDTMTVQYPLLLGGKEAWEQGGYDRAGFSVNVNIRTMKVTGLYGLTTQNYQSSNYAAETDKNRLLKFALQGDLWPQPTYPEENFKVKEVEIKLGTPSVQYMRYWKYEGNQSSELFLPALVFPVIDKSQADEYFTKKVVVVPLVREILDSAERENTITPPAILEYRKDMGSSSSQILTPTQEPLPPEKVQN
ncbi:MAG: hypothetical protein WC445_04110 [Patescibacteria group bacterium]